MTFFKKVLKEDYNYYQLKMNCIQTKVLIFVNKRSLKGYNISISISIDNGGEIKWIG